MQLNDRYCFMCSKLLNGRLGQKFCGDYCRNAYNNQRNGEQNNYIRNVNNLLRRNRRILSAAVDPMGRRNVPRDYLLAAGFDFRFYTHQQTNRKGEIFNFCYEYGYLQLAAGRVRVIRTGITAKK